MADSTLEDHLNTIFENVNNWLKFAEAKNGVLLSINGGSVIGLLAYLRDAPEIASCTLTWTLVPAFILATIVLLVSFIPLCDRIIPRNRKSKGPVYDNCNLIYFKHIKDLSFEEYLARLNKSISSISGNSELTFTRLQEDLAQQIVTNAGIAYRKFLYFIIGFGLIY